jgi:D-amino peptidase
MRVVLSVDMEGVSQLRDPYEIFACRAEYWLTGKARIEADTVAAVEGLVAGGADEVIVLDNHGSGNPQNVSAECLPGAARLETWHVFDLPEKGIDAMLQLGYHSRGGGEGFIAHTYVPGLRLRAGDELISESHGRAWAARVPLIGIVGNDTHSRTLGSLGETPYLVVQRTVSNDLAEPAFAPDEGLDAIRVFARDAARRIGDTPASAAPADVVFAASMPNGAEQAEAMTAAGWRRTGDVEYEAHLGGWSGARPLIAAAMTAALAPLAPHFDGATSASAAAALDPARVARFSALVDRWCGGTHPEWHTRPADELGLLP